ncbi:MAG: hydroxyacid dehydrogenase [Bacteroidia bacterium]|nr:hydroxyacid dehydrogenase [Bacteroidia bacterium]MCZ2247325.1 hydroxyacid dehydrogenase [Bacteroidia bacterium]
MVEEKSVLVIDTVHPLIFEMLRERGYTLTEAYTWDKERIKEEIHQFEGVIIRSRIKLDKTIIDAGSKLQFIARYGAGMENIDVEYAESKNIRCLNAAAGNKDAVGEHALGMLLCLFNNINKANAEVRQYQWLREENRGEELAGKTVGIIGYGNMGSAFAQRLLGFDAEVLIYDKYKSNYLPAGSPYKESKLEDIFERAEVLSLHVPLTAETNGMFNYQWLSNIKKPFYLINTARGKILNTTDAVRLMQEQKIKGMCLDVLEYEDTSFEHLNAAHSNAALSYLMQSNKVVLTPHIAGWSHQSNYKLARELALAVLSV